eukprot:7098006-Prymnesium_polylepis.1
MQRKSRRACARCVAYEPRARMLGTRGTEARGRWRRPRPQGAWRESRTECGAPDRRGKAMRDARGMMRITWLCTQRVSRQS